MSKIIFTKNQREKLSNNVNVVKCSNKAITYSKEFKIKSVNRYLKEWLTPKQIFLEAGFDLNVIGKYKPGDLISDWIKVFKRKGSIGLTVETRGKKGGRPRIEKDLNPEEQIKRLKLEILYLKEENDFLAKLRAKRSE